MQCDSIFPEKAEMAMKSDTKSKFTPKGLPTLVGSLPLDDHEEALDIMLKYVPEVPVWIQLPFHPEERLISQFTEGFPGLVIEDESIYFDTASPTFEQELLSFYEDYLLVSEGDLPLSQSRFAFGLSRGHGLAAFIKRIADTPEKPVALKGQVTGPFTFLTGVCDQNKKYILYDDRLRDAAVKGLALKAAWQTETLRQFNLPTLVSIDEPGLAAYGSSALISVSRKDVTGMLQEVKDAIRKAGGLAGVHVCANTDWSLLTESRMDFISFDAYNYFDRFILYRNEVLSFLDEGGMIAWGIVPTSNPDDIRNENATSLVDKWRSEAEKLAEGPITVASILDQSLITPSCGMGALSPYLSERVLKLTREVSDALRKDLL